MRCISLTFLILISLLSAAAVAVASDGREIGNGGDPVVFEFETSAREAIADIKADPASFPGVPSEQLEKALSEASIYVVRYNLRVEHEGVAQEAAAVNYRDSGKILINFYRWQEIERASIRKALALHELLGLVGLEGTGNYAISRRYLNFLGDRCDAPSGLCMDFPKERMFTEVKFYRYLARPSTLRSHMACDESNLSLLKLLVKREIRNKCFSAGYSQCELEQPVVIANGILWQDHTLFPLMGPMIHPKNYGKPQYPMGPQAYGCIVQMQAKGKR